MKLIFPKTLIINNNIKLKFCKYFPYKEESPYDLFYKLIMNLDPDKTPNIIIDEIRRSTPKSISKSPREQIDDYRIYLKNKKDKSMTMEEIRLFGSLLGSKYIETETDIFYCCISSISLTEYLIT